MKRLEPTAALPPQPILIPHADAGRAASVLLISDGAVDAVLQRLQDELDAALVRVPSAAAALPALRGGRVALILLQLACTPGELLGHVRLLHAHRHACHIPLLVLLPAGTAVPLDEAYAAGATDVLAAPLSYAMLKAKTEFFLGALRPAAVRRVGDPATLDAIALELRESEERYRLLFESIDEGVCVIDMLFDAKGAPYDYRFLEMNEAFVRHTGLHNAIGKTMLELVPGHDAHWFATYGRVAMTGEPVRFVNEAKAMGRWYDVYATPAGRAGSNKVAVLFTDITERMHADQELRRLAADLSTADRRKTEFLATLAHELRNPLAPLLSGLQVMRMAAGDPAVLARVQDIMDRQLRHMVELVDDLLDVARITHGQVELKRDWIDLRDVLSAAVETSLPLVEGGNHRLRVDAPEQPLPLYADATRLIQVVSNLLNNAAKYTPCGGAIALAAGVEGDAAVVTVSDNGAGIPAAALESVFEMFTQVGRDHDRSKGGLGIGLSLVRSLVALHGGTVEAASPGLGQGSVFRVRLPLAAPDAASPEAMPPGAEAEPAPARQPLRVLVVDDNRDAAETLTALLGLLGHVVLAAGDGQQALASIRSFRPHAVFLDIGMPGLSGYEVAARIRADPDAAGTLLVALTGWGGHNERARSAEAGFDAHLTKPVDLAAIQAALEKV